MVMGIPGPSPIVNVPVPVHSNTAQSAPPLIRSTRCDQSGKMASVSRATLCRSVVHGVTGSQKTPSGAKSAANSSGPCTDSKVRAHSSQSRSGLTGACPPCSPRRLSASKVTTASSSGSTSSGRTNWCASATRRTAVPQAVNPTAWRAKLIGPSVTFTSTTP